jgi:excisionase family DNA binding protein
VEKQKPESMLLTVQEAMNELRMCRTTIERLMERGELKKVRALKRGIRITRQSLNAYVARKAR